MICCEPHIDYFVNVASTTFPYTNSMRAAYGDYPKIDVLYYNEETQDYDLSHNSTAVKLIGNPPNTIIIDHGGSYTGLISIR